MKKKILNCLLILCLIVPCLFTLTACGQNPGPKTLTKADYIEVFESVTSTYKGYLTGTQPSTVSLASDIISDDDFVDANNNTQAKNMAKASMAMLYFMRNICENEDFTLTSDAFDSVVDDSTYTYDIRLKMSYNDSTSTIKAEVYADYRDNSYINYFVFDINYDFDTDTLNNFSILGFSGTDTTPTTNGVRYYKFANNNLKVLSNEASSFETFAEGVLDNMDAFSSNEWSTNAPDYSTEYLSAMTEAMS